MRKTSSPFNFLGLALLLALAACSHAKPQALTSDPSRYDQIVLVGTNDFHGYLRPNAADFGGSKVISGGAEWFAGYVRILEKKFGDRLVLLDAGDIFQGTMESNQFKGKSTMEYYNLLPYRAAAVGNHEFDYGPLKKHDKDRLGTLKKRISEAHFPFLQANIFFKKSGRRWEEKNLRASTIIEAGGHKIGVIGLTTTSTPGKTSPLNIQPLEFRDFVEPAVAEAKELRARGAELVIVTTHEGGEKPGDPIYNFLHALPKGTVDAVVSGHSHTEIHTLVNGVPVIQSKTRGVFFGRVDLFVEKATHKIDPSLTRIHDMRSICGTWFANAEKCDPKEAKDAVAAGKAKEKDFLPLRPPVYEGEAVQPDLKVRETLEPFFEKTEELRREVLGQATKDFEYLESGENQMGFLFLHAFQWKFPQAKVIYTNGGGFRRRISKGPITYGDIFEMHPFDNFAVTVEMTGKQLRSLVQVSTSGYSMIPAVLGVRLKYDSSDKPEFQRDINGDGKKEQWENNRLLSLTWEDGRPVKDDETFLVATNDYLVSGGDNTAHVFNQIPAARKHYTDFADRDVIAEYLKAHPRMEFPTKDEPRISVQGTARGPEIH